MTDGTGEGSDDQALRHELSHAARPAPQPRFWRPDLSSLDADEHLARAAHRVRDVAAPLSRGPEIASDVLDRLPVAGPSAASAALGAITDRVRAAVPDPGSLSGVARRALPGGGVPTSPAGLAQAAGVPGMPDIPSLPTLPGMPDLPSLPSMPELPGAADAMGAARSAGQDVLAGAAETAGSALAGAAGTPLPDMDDLLEALSDRMLREVERRGGRWTEMF